MADKKKAPPAGPDNNRRLAFLEQGVERLQAELGKLGIECDNKDHVFGDAARAIAERDLTIKVQGEAVQAAPSMLASALAAAGIALEQGDDPVLVAIQAIDGAGAVRKAMIENDLPFDPSGTVFDAAVKLLTEKPPEAGKATDVEAKLRAALEQANVEIDKLEAEVAELKGEAAEPEAPAVRERPDGARDAGAAHNPEPPSRRSKEGKALAAEIEAEGTELLAIVAAKGAELVFSNGDYEIVDFEPVPLTVADLAFTSGSVRVTRKIYLKGAAQREAIAGGALFIGGKQARWCQLPTPIVIDPGQERAFENIFRFN